MQDELITDSGVKLYLDSSYRKEWNAAVTAKVAALPAKINSKYKKTYDQLNIGDEVCVSYNVVANFSFVGDGERFMATTEGNDYFREFVNGKGDWIKIYALPKRSKIGVTDMMWAGVCYNKFKQYVSGEQGTQSEIERWLAQFPIGKTDIYSFNNFFEYKKKDYWKCDLDEIFAVKRKGQLKAVGNRIICKPIDEDVPNEMLIAEHKGHKVQIRYQDRARVISGGKDKGTKKDDIISFDPRHLEKYTFWNKDYYLINENLVTGKWN